MTTHLFLFFNAITPLHNGSGEGLGMVDRQIMRERTTGFPIVQSTSIKGVLREAYDQKLVAEATDAEKKKGEKKLFALFGPPPEKSGDHAGALSIGDAQVLAFPVRSLKGAWVWLTSPLALMRLARRVRLAGLETKMPKLFALLTNLTGNIAGGQGCLEMHDATLKLLVQERLLLEEFSFPYKYLTDLKDFAGEMAEILFPDTRDNFLKNFFAEKLVLLNDADFTFFVKETTEVVANIRIDESGTTESGSLRYSEYLPAETVLYSHVTCGPPRKPVKDKNYYQGLNLEGSDDVVGIFLEPDLFPQFLQVGGDETTGKGLVALQYLQR